MCRVLRTTCRGQSRLVSCRRAVVTAKTSIVAWMRELAPRVVLAKPQKHIALRSGGGLPEEAGLGPGDRESETACRA
jgi:hypothetical protein